MVYSRRAAGRRLTESFYPRQLSVIGAGRSVGYKMDGSCPSKQAASTAEAAAAAVVVGSKRAAAAKEQSMTACHLTSVSLNFKTSGQELCHPHKIRTEEARVP